jgi:hypothetical protein
VFKIIAAVGFAGIAGITWISYHMADLRIPLCGDYIDDTYRACVIRGEASRDATLTYGLIAALAFILGCLIVYALIWARTSRSIDSGESSASMHRQNNARLPCGESRG